MEIEKLFETFSDCGNVLNSCTAARCMPQSCCYLRAFVRADTSYFVGILYRALISHVIITAIKCKQHCYKTNTAGVPLNTYTSVHSILRLGVTRLP